MVNNISVLNKQDCCGCGACHNICPAGAISLQENSEGFLYPQIDKNKCTNCGLCKKTCACINPTYKNLNNPECFAFMAVDKIRMGSSSGGAFPILAYNFVNNGGYVAGAVFNNDCGVEHIVSNLSEDIEKMRSSKYLQSNTKNCYMEIKELLNEGKKVLFTGCPCQVAGLKAYLQNDYENLFCVDLVCHGVPSPKVFKKYIQEEYLKTANEKWLNTNFRDKSASWSKYNITTDTTLSSHTHLAKDDNYIKLFLKNIILRSCCTNCKFSTFPRQGDITLGDFWGINKFRKIYNDEKGTSVVLINNNKGYTLSRILKLNSKLYTPIPLQIAKNGNPCLHKCSIEDKNRKLFFSISDKMKISECLEYCETDKTDYIIVNLWDSKFNYGAMLTAYALQTAISEYGYVCKLLDTGEKTDKIWFTDSWMRKFVDKYLNITTSLDYKGAHRLSKSARGIILGSDQVLRSQYTCKSIKKYMLEWVDKNTSKIAISPSFGHFEEEWLNYEKLTPKIVKYIKKQLKTFKYISCREKSGKDIYKNVFGLNSDVLLDPVFFIDKKYYDQIADDSHIEIKNKYAFYILEQDNVLYKNLRAKAENCSKELFDINIYHYTVNDWLRVIKDCELFITDSFHGTCFALIFNKPFIFIENGVRGNARFENLNELFDLNQFIYNEDKSIESYINSDFSSINDILHKETERCKIILGKIFNENYSNNINYRQVGFCTNFSCNYIKHYCYYKFIKFLSKYGSKSKRNIYKKKLNKIKFELDWRII